LAPSQEVGVLQTLYVGLLPDNIIHERVKNCSLVLEVPSTLPLKKRRYP
jgi:hypothetical protein